MFLPVRSVGETKVLAARGGRPVEEAAGVGIPGRAGHHLPAAVPVAHKVPVRPVVVFVAALNEEHIGQVGRAVLGGQRPGGDLRQMEKMAQQRSAIRTLTNERTKGGAPVQPKARPP